MVKKHPGNDPPDGQDSVFFCFFLSSPFRAQQSGLHLFLLHTRSDTDTHAHTHQHKETQVFSALGGGPAIIQAMEDGGSAEKMEVDEEEQKGGRTTPRRWSGD